MTIEEVQAQLLEAQDTAKQLEAEKQNIIAERDKLAEENASLKTINQKYFLRLTSDKPKEDPQEDTDEKILTSDDIVKQLLGGKK